MKVQQLSVFLENKPGQMIEPCRMLAQCGINISTLTLADTQKFGILRLIVSEPERAQQLLRDAGYIVKATEVLAVEVADRPGGLAEILGLFQNCAINIEYMYAFTRGRDDKAVIIFRFDDPDAAADRLQAAGISVVASQEVYGQ